MSDAPFSAFAPLVLATLALLSGSPAFSQPIAEASPAPVTLRMDADTPPVAAAQAVAPAAASAPEAAALPPATTANSPTGNATNASDDVIRDAHDAFLRRDRARLALLRATAFTNHLPLTPWVDYWELTNRLSEVSSDEVEQFYARWPGSYVEDRLRNDWLLEVGHRRDWDAFKRDYPRFRMNDDRSVTCYATLVDHLAGKEVHDAALAQWLAIKDIDGGCQLMAQTLYDDKVFTDADVWRRMRQASELPAKSAERALRGAAQILGKPASKEMGTLLDNPARFITRKADVATTRRNDMVTIALARMGASDPAAAALQLQERWQSAIGADNAAWAWAVIARHGAQSLLPDAVDWADRAWAARKPHKGEKPGPPDWSDETLGWHARAALRAGSGTQRWKDVARAIDAMSATERAQDNWTYWRAQAALSLGLAAPGADSEAAIAEARRQLKTLSANVSFYGLLSAEDLGGQFVLPPRPVPLTPLERGLAHANPGLLRGLALTALDMRDEGRREWNFTLRGMGDRDLLAAAQWACDQSDWQLCINTSERTKAEIDIAQRYPLPFRRDIVEAATKAGLDPAFVFGLIRQETRFMGNMRSAVGANGLMQLMPATAKWAAKKAGIAYRPELITDSSTNLRIGSFYLKMVLESFGGSDPMAAAAYNAGPARPRRWRGGLMLAPEVWTENVPFYETRDYVKKVMTNAAIYAALLGDKGPQLRPRLGPQIGPRDAEQPPAADMP
ncbi:lytic transglycosylase domain-containing protein [Scleromatobacter humisilvae]|uniref:Lytic transglycosylase domain-containing protein n=1 Tax=Scleromatobacter humisilvae TaxID=2897159 RepID=A0A9X2C1Y1_9BURK|nr:lytic transglycosylase domain-containing protein [Scleromatobacter humisilvae]MCK9685475.1 lytic transglycosylase domain-containing protein [Scleromatobacter humisilvae]